MRKFPATSLRLWAECPGLATRTRVFPGLATPASKSKVYPRRLSPSPLKSRLRGLWTHIYRGQKQNVNWTNCSSTHTAARLFPCVRVSNLFVSNVSALKATFFLGKSASYVGVYWPSEKENWPKLSWNKTKRKLSTGQFKALLRLWEQDVNEK